MTRFARALNCGAFAASGLMASPPRAGGDKRPASAINEANPNAPMPVPHLHKKSRRVRNASSRRGLWFGIASVIVTQFRVSAAKFSTCETGRSRPDSLILVMNAIPPFALALLSVALALADEPKEIPLWPNGAPGSEGKTDKEVVRQGTNGEHSVSSVHHP